MIFVVCGQIKSASTFLANVTREVCTTFSGDQNALRRRLLTGPLEKHLNFWEGELWPLVEVADKMRPGEHTSLKTHARFLPGYADTLNREDIQFLISYRHPGDAALSVFEAGEKARRNNNTSQGFEQLLTYQQAIDRIADNLERSTIPWLKSNLGMAFDYDTLTRDPDTVLSRICGRIDEDPAALTGNESLQSLLRGEKRVYNFNKGVSGRHAETFSPEDMGYLEARCGRFIRFCKGEIPAADL